MPWMSKRAMAEQAAAMTRLRRAVAEADADRAEMAAEKVAAIRRADEANGALELARVELSLTRRDNRGLRQQLDNALGYGAEELTAIEAGKTKPREKAVSA